MRKLLMFTAAIAMLFSCSESPIPEPEPQPEPKPEKWAINISTNITKATDTALKMVTRLAFML